MNGKRILLVDDEARLREMLKTYLVHEGYDVVEAADGKEAMELFHSQEYALVILDVMLPQVDGWTVCREIRRTSQVPIIMLTARGEEYDRLFGFDLGVDDYIVKPFSPKELLARIKAIIRRSEQSDDHLGRIVIKGLEIELSSRSVFVDGSELALTPREYDLLSFFVQHQNQVFTREQLLDVVWGYDFAGDSRTVDTHVKMLRERLGDYRRFLITVWGVGYKFQEVD
ncbi:MAG TPA: DNA-binding response regulator [Firmicutes bacterium]|nr:DNA-binding response regulator [Bacillota bacterium]